MFLEAEVDVHAFDAVGHARDVQDLDAVFRVHAWNRLGRHLGNHDARVDGAIHARLRKKRERRRMDILVEVHDGSRELLELLLFRARHEFLPRSAQVPAALTKAIGAEAPHVHRRNAQRRYYEGNPPSREHFRGVGRKQEELGARKERGHDDHLPQCPLSHVAEVEEQKSSR